MPSAHSVKLRPLEREDLRYVHQLDNNASVMRYWFEEPYEAFVELSDLYDKHIHDQSERRFVVECDGEKAGLVELVEINHVHRRAEFQIIISPEYQGKGLATRAAKLAMDYGFTVLNLYKLYLIVDKENEKRFTFTASLAFRLKVN
ncbi:spermidine N1-acetyltransferase [Escherichia coli]|uniref:Spermidine N1-acetyltransferase n=1 Tax=Escherichia coli TaxID=562 RepID=A0A377BBM9_ECOLX|nr:spermidine N1-acetyltransferase [Escherichia coli]